MESKRAMARDEQVVVFLFSLFAGGHLRIAIL
jgi:hypothetical protein